MAKAATTDKGQITCPFTVQIDTREQAPYEFVGLKENVNRGSKVIEVPTHRLVCPFGDYSILGAARFIGLERKSKADLYGSVSRRANFEGRLQAMHDRRLDAGIEHTYFAVIVEAELQEVLTKRPPHCRINTKALNRTILAWRQRYLVDWYFVPDRTYAEHFTFRVLERYWKDRKKGARNGTPQRRPENPILQVCPQDRIVLDLDRP